MTRIIQQVTIDDTNSLYLVSFDKKSSELWFRSSLEPQYLQKETVAFKGNMVYTNHFHANYLNSVINK